MKYRLGIDLGTTSIGVVALALNSENKPVKHLWHSVRIFPESLESNQSGMLKPKKAARRLARQQRRQLERKARRIRRVAHLAPLLGLDKSTIKPHIGYGFSRLRAKAARERIEITDLFHVLLRLAKKRGYKGEFRSARNDQKVGKVKAGATSLEKAMVSLANEKKVEFVTLGEYLYHRNENIGLPVRLKVEREGVENFYALRPMLELEFSKIWETQAGFHPILKKTYKDKSIRDNFFEAIFYQRPLKSPSMLVGHCSLERNLPRAPRAQPAAQDFRIEKTIGDLRWGFGRNSQALSLNQRNVIREILNDPDRLRADGTITFTNIYNLLESAGCPRSESSQLNLEGASRAELKGNTTRVVFNRIGLLQEWQELEAIRKVQVINFLADLGSPEQLDRDDWHSNISKSKPTEKNKMRSFHLQVIQFINCIRSSEHFDRLSKMGFEGGRSSYSIKALVNLSDWLREPIWVNGDPGENPRIDEDAAIRACYPKNSLSSEFNSRIKIAPRTHNDIVDGALRQLHLVLNQCISTLGTTPTEIIIETTRELSAGAAKRNEWESISNNNQKKRKAAAKDISDHGQIATATKIMRYQLWEEQETHCPYCADVISIAQALNGAETHYEHILPKNLTQIGRKRSELLLAHHGCNDAKGNRTPWEAFRHDDQRWAQVTGISRRFEVLGKKYYVKNRPLAMAYFRKAKLLLLEDFSDEVLDDKSIAGFADRQLHQTSWIAKAAISWLGTICPNVFASRGQMTAILRSAWGLDTVIPEVRYSEGYAVLDTAGEVINRGDFEQFSRQWRGQPLPEKQMLTDRRLDKRIDHRHHIIDAFIIALTSRGLYQKIGKQYERETQNFSPNNKRSSSSVIEPPIVHVRSIASEIVANCNISHKPDRNPTGRFFEDTAYGKERGNDSGKARLLKRYKLIELADSKNSLAKTISNMEIISSDRVREIVLTEFNKRTNKGLSPKQALSTPILYPEYRTEIHSVRCFQKQGLGFKLADKVLIFTNTSRTGTHVKRLVSDGYACIEIGLKGFSVNLITHSQFSKKLNKSRDAIRFFKNDTVIDSSDNKKYLIRQFNSSDGGAIFMTPVTETRAINSLKSSDGKRKVSGRGLLRLTLCE
jgi:CRISPR-associated endonuclease Csn1